MKSIQGMTVAIIGGGTLQLPVIRTAKELSLFTVVVDQNPECVGAQACDYFIESSTQDIEATVHEMEKFHHNTKQINGVLTVGTDVSTTVAACAKKLGLPGITPEAALSASDKYLMRQTLRQANIPVPDFELVDSYSKAIEIFEKLESDCVIKPVQNMGARGVRRITKIDELKDAYELAVSYSQNRKVIVEKYIDAPELSIDALIHNNQIHITGVADRIIEYEPYFVETGHILPSNLPQEQVNYAIETFKKGIRALNLHIGAAKGDIKVSGSGCFIGEIAARLSGGFMSAYTYPYATGVDLMKNILYISLGFPPVDLEPTHNWVAVERAIIAPPGIIKQIEGLDDVKTVKYFKDVFFDCKIGDKINAPKNNLDKCGHIIVAAPNRTAAIIASHNAVSKIKVRTVEESDQLIPESKINETAINRLNGRCFVCVECNGLRCKGMMPGVGGIGNGIGFVRSVEKFKEIALIPNYINDSKMVDTEIEFIGKKLDTPVMPAPITGAVTNLASAITELQLARSIVKGANQAGTLGFVGDGATPTKYQIGIKVVFENFGMAVPIFKPRYDQKLILQRIKAAKEFGVSGIGMDIDAASFMTMEMKGQSTSTKNVDELKELVQYAKLPFFLKGVLSPKDCVNAIEAGVGVIIVSNHGGRVSDSLISPIEALVNIKKEIGDRIPIVLDGGVRSGNDVAKAIALGADAVMIGRPIMINAIGGGAQGVRQYINKITLELKRIMALLGVNSIKELKNNREVVSCLKNGKTNGDYLK